MYTVNCKKKCSITVVVKRGIEVVRRAVRLATSHQGRLGGEGGIS